MLTRFFSLFLCLICHGAAAQNIRVVDFNTFQKEVLKPASDTTYLVNFFASWCAPCLAEIPMLTDFAESQKNEKFKLLFVSLDFKKNYKKSLLPLIKKYGLGPVVFLLDAPNANDWIGSIDADWSGAIPASLLINTDKKQWKFTTQLLTLDFLKTWIE